MFTVKIKKILSVFLICVFVFCALGCSKKSSSSDKKVRVLASFSNKDTYKQAIMKAMESYSKESNIDVDIKIADENIERQVNDIKAAKQNGYDAVACTLVDPDTAQQIINAAGDLPVIFFNIAPDDSKLKKDKYIYVGSDENEAVNLTAKAIESKFASNKKFNAVLFQGERSNKSAIVRTEALKYKLKKDGFDVNYVFNDSASWNRDKAKEMFKTFLKLKNSYDCIIANNDDMALGVIDAMKEEKINPSSVPIYGIDAMSEACKSIINGEMTFTVKQSAEGQAQCVLQAARALSDGKSISEIKYADKSGKYMWYPYTAVDKSNAADFAEE